MAVEHGSRVKLAFTATYLDDESVTVDSEPERSGETLTFDVEILEIE